ncbi:MAG: DNA repair protein RecO [Oscillospiraceae bacterium]|nr:DNA repair protein RecO [Oscillospiraceae bacterium]
MYKTLRGLVLREVRYKESSKMLTILTEEEGKLSAEGRGALRRGSKIAAASQQLCYSELTFFERQGRYTLTEGSTLEDFSALRDRFEDFALGVYFAELMEAASDEDSPNAAVLHLGLNSLFALSRQLYSPEHIKAVFELRLMCLAGFEPALEACSGCGSVDINNPRFHLQGGCVHCTDCGGGEGRSVALCAASLAAMRHVAHAQPKKVFSFTLDEAAAARFHYAAEEYTLCQLDRRFGTLDYWKTVKG